MTAPLVFTGVTLRVVHRGSSDHVFGGFEASSEAPRAFDLTVPAHRTVVALGDETSGVDTLGSLAMGLEQPIAGTVTVFDTEIASLPRRAQLAFRRRIGYLPAGDALLQNLSLRENLLLPILFGGHYPRTEVEGRIDVILGQLRLTRVGHRRPAWVTDEERRRAALARALALDPELVILEQPFDGLTDRVASELLELARGGETSEGGRRTVFISGQSLPAALRRRVDVQVRVQAGQAQPILT